MARDLLVTWLNDAYAMEQSQTEMLKHFIKDFESNKSICQKLEEHLAQTERQAEEVKDCLRRLGKDTSHTKSLFGNIMGAMQGMSTTGLKDEQVKDMIMIHAGEHFEYACYEALVAAAKSADQEEIATICQEIADEERAVADWSKAQLPVVTERALSQQAD
jgi:ferritin-like metal-binding protein YciE